MRRLTLALLLVSSLAATACSDAQPTVEVTPTPGAALPDGFVLSASPGEATGVAGTKSAAKEGDTVTVRGRIGGNAKPLVAGRASFLLADTETIVACDKMPGDDHCEVPWDYCCEDKAKIKDGTITVQVVGADGRPLATDLTSVPGVEAGAYVVVTGRVGPRPNQDVLVLDATGLFVTNE